MAKKITNQDDLEILDLSDPSNNDETDNTDTPEKKPRKGNMLLHIILGVAILMVILAIVLRINSWNNKKIVISHGEEDYDVELEIECLDYFMYPTEEQKVLRNADGKEHILVIGNQYLSRCSDDSVSVIELLKERVDAEFITLISERSRLTAITTPNPADSFDTLNLYAVTSILCSEIRQIPAFYDIEDVFLHPESKDAYAQTLLEVDMNTIDTVLIMYDLTDYYNALPPIAGGEDNVTGLYGALYCSIQLLQENYPHLEIIVSSPMPCYMQRSDNSIEFSEVTDYGYGNSSIYVNHEYNASLASYVSYIDNYHYVVTEDNIFEYVEGVRLTPKGVETVANHIIEFLNK